MMAKSELQEDVTDEGASKTLHNFSCVLAQSSSDRQIVYTLGQCFHEYFPAIGIFSREREWFVYSLSQIDVTVTSVTVISYTYVIVVCTGTQ